MPLGNVNITVLNGQINRTADSVDGISCILSYNSTITGLTSAKYNSIEDIEAAGYTNAAYPIEHYQAREFFKQNPNGELYLALAPTGATYDFAETLTLQRQYEGKIKNIAIIGATDSTTLSSDITDIKTQQTVLLGEIKPFYSVLLEMDVSGYTSSDINSLTDLRDGGTDNRWVSVVIGSDGSEDGLTIETAQGKTISAIGSVLGVISRIDVASNPGAVGLNNLLNLTDEYTIPRIGATDVVTLTDTIVDQTHDYGYIFVRKFPTSTGSFISGYPVSTNSTDDFVDGTITRTVYKAFVGIYQDLLPFVNGKVKVVNSKLTTDEVLKFQNAGSRNLRNMLTLEEISNYGVLVPADQDVISTGQVQINATIVPYGTSKQINVSLGIATSV